MKTAINGSGLLNLTDVLEVMRPLAPGIDENDPKAIEKFKKKVEALTKAGESGLLTQYAQLGKYLLPTSDTVKSLPTGCYRIDNLPDRGVCFSAQKLVTDTIMRLPDSKSDEVISEIEKFWGLKDKYAQFGLSFKRGFLLHGPPGSGKTCTVTLIVDQMIKRGGIVVFGENPVVVGAGLAAMREIEPDRPLVVVLEDLDAIVARYGEPQLLSLLDGEMQVNNVIFIATTNYPDNLDQRIINRPSRFDMIVKIDVPNDAARKMYLESRLNGKTTVADSEGEHDLVPLSKGFSIAHLRELVVATQVFGHKVETTVQRLKRMKFVPKSGSSGNKMGLSMWNDEEGGSNE